MKNLKIMAVIAFVIVAMVACGNKDNSNSMSKDKGMEKEMAGDQMKDDKMMDDKMSGDMKDDKMMDDKMNHMKDDKMMDDKMSGDMKDGKMMDDKMSDHMKDDKMMDDKMSDPMKDDKMMDDKMEKMNKGDMAPDFELMDKDGNTFSLMGQKGKKVYTKFWASWCSICLAGLEELNTLAGEDNDFEIVTIVSPEFRGEKSKEDFIKWFDTLDYKNVRVLFDEDGKVAEAYGVRAYPTSAIIGSDGVLVKVNPGHLAADGIKAEFAEVK